VLFGITSKNVLSFLVCILLLLVLLFLAVIVYWLPGSCKQVTSDTWWADHHGAVDLDCRVASTAARRLVADWL